MCKIFFRAVKGGGGGGELVFFSPSLTTKDISGIQFDFSGLEISQAFDKREKRYLCYFQQN